MAMRPKVKDEITRIIEEAESNGARVPSAWIICMLERRGQK